ncbi:MAG: zinc dependent phospholipase C family protein [Oscillospiraceae bacterium]|nr:zinc dependent phospholipase C family protein [Oscillospiraceae bacterium]
MPGTATHLAIADKIYFILGGDVIKNLPLFFGGNIAPDAIHAKKDYQRIDKKRSHLCEGIRSYGYGYPEVAKLFRDRVNEFIENYYMNANGDKDLYLGYIVHLLADELYLLNVYKHLEEHLINNGVNPNEPDFRKNLADSVNNSGYKDIWGKIGNAYEISIHEYQFKQNVADVLEAAPDYEVKNYITMDEIKTSKHWVIDTVVKNEPAQDNVMNRDRDIAIEFLDFTAEDIIARLSGKDDIIKIL